MIAIRKAVLRFKELNPQIKNKEIAKMLFPEKSPGRAESLLSRWMNGFELEKIRIGQVRQICKVLNVTPNDLIKWER